MIGKSLLLTAWVVISLAFESRAQQSTTWIKSFFSFKKREAPAPIAPAALTVVDGNAFAIIGRVTKDLKRSGADTAEIAKFQEEAMSGDYDNVLQTCMRWVEVE